RTTSSWWRCRQSLRHACAGSADASGAVSPRSGACVPVARSCVCSTPRDGTSASRGSDTITSDEQGRHMRMTLAAASGAGLGFLALLPLPAAPPVPRLLRHGNPPARPRRFWLTLLVGREFGTAGAAAAATWAALAAPGILPGYLAAVLAGAAAFLVA